ncbi:MAG TPA: hypothetical protein VE397_09520 [Stellaceae bacterium]|jgi:hypothetical protein|nr:hypothetical protein [Stellaceae bacterium]
MAPQRTTLHEVFAGARMPLKRRLMPFDGIAAAEAISRDYSEFTCSDAGLGLISADEMRHMGRQ